MSMQFHRAVEDMEICSANSDGFSFVISYETSAGQAFTDTPAMSRRGARSMSAVAPSRSVARLSRRSLTPRKPATPPGCHMIRLTETREITRGAASGFSVAMRERLIRNPSPFHSFA